MKKLLIIICLFSYCSLYAQNFEVVAELDYSAIGLYKANDLFLIEKGRLYQNSYENVVSIYNEDFTYVGEIYHSYDFKLSQMYYMDNLQGGLGTGSTRDNYAKYLGFTQTLFNDDEYYEFVYYKSEELLISRAAFFDENGTRVVSEKVLERISPPEGKTFRGTEPNVYSINGKEYLGIETTTDRSRIYYRIDKDSPSMIKQGVMISENSGPVIYDISGKRLSAISKGINIVKEEDGSVRKVIGK